MDTSLVFLGSIFPVVVLIIVWLKIRSHSPFNSFISNELRTIKVMLTDETSLQNYYLTQDKRLGRIEEKLNKLTDLDLLQRHSQEQILQASTIITLLEECQNNGLLKAVLNESFQVTNNSLEKVLWALRFDQDKYAESTQPTLNTCVESDDIVKIKSIK